MSLSLQSGSFDEEGPALLVHGGAWDIPNDVLDAHRDGLRAAVRRGREQLRRGAAAVDVVTSVVAVLEAHGAFDAGRGAMLNQKGEAELDAGVMDGATLAYGAVLATKQLAQPVRVARRLLDVGEGRVRMLAGEGAERFAEAEGMERVENSCLICDRERQRYEQIRSQVGRDHPSVSFLPGVPDEATEMDRNGTDTVGAVARDAEGRLAAATSTGGTPFKPPGRVGDSPLPGSGFYATETGAAGATGWGEAISAVVLSSRAVLDLDADTHPETVVRRRLAHMHKSVANPDGDGATGGLLLMTADGRAAWAYTTPRMARAGWRNGDELWVDV
jgi:beta-aspartyl-peptidase (threonine type)